MTTIERIAMTLFAVACLPIFMLRIVLTALYYWLQGMAHIWEITL